MVDTMQALPASVIDPAPVPAVPMLVFARRIGHALDVPVQRPHDTDARKHRRAVKLDHQEQGFYRGAVTSAIVHWCKRAVSARKPPVRAWHFGR